MSLADELRGTPPRGFRIAFPPGWRHYPVDENGRKALLAEVSARAKAIGRPDVDALLRRKVNEQFAGLRRSRGVAMYLPGEDAASEAGMPTSMVASRWHSPLGVPIVDDIRARAVAEVLTIEMPHGTVYRWVRDRTGAETGEGVMTRTVSYVYPEPGEDPHAGVLLTAGILHNDDDETAAVTAALVELCDAIVETFRWN